MALIKCEECGKEISEEARTCPNCGAKLKTNRNNILKQWWFWFIIVIIIIVTVLIIVLTNKKENTRKSKGIGSSGISKEEFDKIEVGMKHIEVDGIIYELSEVDDKEYTESYKLTVIANEDDGIIYEEKHYGENGGYAIITYKEYYDTYTSKVIKKESFDLE